MNTRLKILLLTCVIVAFGAMASAADVQWVRVTVLLETGRADAARPQDTLIPGGIYSLDEVQKRGLAAVDGEILERIRHLGESMRGAEESMRLATLLARQYYLRLEVGKKAVLPAVDLNPRLSVVFIPERFVGDRVVCKVQFLEPEGPIRTPDFTGKPITLTLKDADIQDVLRVFSRVAPVEIIVDPAVTGSVTVDLRDVPWDQALDLVLRVTGLGWTRNNGTIRVVPLGELSGRKKVRTEATLTLPRGSWGSSRIASRGDENNPTMLLLVESVDGPPNLAAERDGLVHPRRVSLVAPTPDDEENSLGEIAVFRATVTTDGEPRNAKVLASPSPAYAERLLEALKQWRFRTVLDEAGRKQEAVVGYGVRFRPQRGAVILGGAPHVGVEINASPDAKKPGNYVITVIVTDLDSGGVLSAPRVVTRKGEEARVSTMVTAPDADQATLKMRILVAEDGTGVSYSWTLVTADTVVASHSAEFTL